VNSSLKASDGSTLAYSIDSALASWQKPRATLVMHHGVGFNRDAWVLWLPRLLAAGYRLIRIDMRGHGGSVRPEDGYRWTTERFLDDLNEILDAEGVGEAHFVGESWGGTIGLAWAARFPERAKTVSVMSTTYAGALVPLIDGFAELIRKDGIAAWARTMNEARFFPDVDADIAGWALETQTACTPHVIADIFTYILKQDIEGELPKIAAPVMILAPQSSPFVRSTLAFELRNRLSDSELALFPGHRHGLVLSGAELACEAMMNFHRRRG
jgi:pimeloyl-ACP methyl ester carboxylesterase